MQKSFDLAGEVEPATTLPMRTSALSSPILITLIVASLLSMLARSICASWRLRIFPTMRNIIYSCKDFFLLLPLRGRQALHHLAHLSDSPGSDSSGRAPDQAVLSVGCSAGGDGGVVNPVLTFHEFRFTITGAFPLKSFVLPCVDSGSA